MSVMEMYGHVQHTHNIMVKEGPVGKGNDLAMPESMRSKWNSTVPV